MTISETSRQIVGLTPYNIRKVNRLLIAAGSPVRITTHGEDEWEGLCSIVCHPETVAESLAAIEFHEDLQAINNRLEGFHKVDIRLALFGEYLPSRS
jgi:hypothetical protein